MDPAEAGEEVRLYEEDGKVKYYSVVKGGTTGTAGGATGGTGATDAAGGAVSVSHLNSLQMALDSARQDAAKKDETINALKLQVEALQKQQQDVNTLLKSDKFTKLMGGNA